MEPGDIVEITTKDQVLEGLVIPRPNILDKDVLVLKLNNGYNIGINTENIISSKVLKKFKSFKANPVEYKKNPALPTVAILSTGGTISSSIDYSSGGVKAVNYTAEDFVAMCPELKRVANLEVESIMQVMSEDIDLRSISEIGDKLKPWLENDSIKGIVLTMGTDTLHYISAGLSFILQGLNKPVIITAAQRSIDRGSSDAFMNLSCAVKAAVSWSGAEVAVCMHGSSDDDYCNLIRASKVRKMHTSKRDAFRPINELPFATISYPDLNISEINKNYSKGSEVLKINSSLSSKVALISIYPGMDPGIIDYYVQKGYKALVLAGTALGHVPTNGDSNLVPNLEKAREKGIIIVIATQTLYGRTHPFVYTNLRTLSLKLGCLFSEDLIPETAYMKMCWVLANYPDNVEEKFTQNLVGEISNSIESKSFLY